MADKRYLDEAGLAEYHGMLPSIESASGSYMNPTTGFFTREREKFAKTIGASVMDTKAMFFAKLFFDAAPTETYLLPATSVSCQNFISGLYFNTVNFDTSAIPGDYRFNISVATSGEESDRAVTVDTNLGGIAFHIIKITP